MNYLNYADGYEEGRGDLSSLTGERTFVVPVLSLMLAVLVAGITLICKAARMIAGFLIKWIIMSKKRGALRGGSL